MVGAGVHTSPVVTRHEVLGILVAILTFGKQNPRPYSPPPRRPGLNSARPLPAIPEPAQAPPRPLGEVLSGHFRIVP